MRVRGKLLLATLVCLLAAGSLLAQSTQGGIQGTVLDEGGQPLPGVTVSITSPSMMGQKSAVTDANGQYRFTLLPPGAYKVVLSLPGYQRMEQENFRVNIGNVSTLDVTLQSAFTEEVVVSGQAPLVDTTSTTIGTNLSQEFYSDLPVGRNYSSVASVTPGVFFDQASDEVPGGENSMSVYGSTGAENAYYINGANTTGVQFGLQGKRLNFEFIQEVQVKTGGYSAEYGRNTGAILNVITKSGGNEFHGDLFGYYDSDSLQANLKSVPAAGALSGSSTRTKYTRSDYGVDIGGYIIKDALWFFAAYDYIDNEDTITAVQDFTSLGGPPEGFSIKNKTTSDLFALKLTWRISDNHSVSASLFGDPRSVKGLQPYYSLAGPPTTFEGGYDTGGSDGAFNYDGVFGESWVVSARYAQHKEKTREMGAGTELPGMFDYTDPLGDGTITSGWDGKSPGFGYFQQFDFTRQQYNADASYFVGDFYGQHEFKAGYEYEHIKIKTQTYNSGGQRLYRFPCSSLRCPDGVDYYYRHRFYVTSNADPTTYTTADIVNPLLVNTKADNYATYVQDRWQPTSNLTFNVGIRLDEQKLYNADGGLSADIKDEWGPRLGFVWDFMGNGKSKIFGHFGRFYETIPTDIIVRSFGGEITAFTYNYTDSLDDVAQLPYEQYPTDTGHIGRGASVLGGGFSNVDPGIKGQYITEYVLGGQYEVAPNWSVSLKGIYRDLGRVIEDALSEDGNYYIGNPSQGLMANTYDIGLYYYYCPDGTSDCHLHAIPPPKRTFTGIEFDVQKRFSDNFQLLFSMLYSRLYGTYDGTFQASTGQLDPNLNSAYDYYDFSVNNSGYLSNDRRQQYKLDGSYRFDWGLTAGLSAHYRTGTPVTAMGYNGWYQNWEFYLSRRGAFGRVDSDWEADVHLAYPVKLGGDMTLNFMVDVFNIFNRQGELTRSQRYDTNEDYHPLRWDTGEALPPLTPDNVNVPVVDPAVGLDGPRPATRSSFNTSTSWQAPRTVRLGVRLSF